MKRFFICFSIAIFTVVGLYGVSEMSRLPRTYDESKTNINEIMQDDDQKNYFMENSESLDSIIDKNNLSETHGLNAVTSNFRRLDTLEQSFILITTVSGSIVILRNGKKGSAKNNEQKHQG